MKTILFMAISLNGIVADDQGKEDFLSHANWTCFCDEAKKCGGFVIGRKTYELVSQYYVGHGFDDLGGTKIIVSSNPNYAVPAGYVHALSPHDAIKKAKAKGMTYLLLTGGPLLNGHFLKEKLVDEVWINIEPTLVGRGKNLIDGFTGEQRLLFASCSRLSEGILQVRYTVERPR